MIPLKRYTALLLALVLCFSFTACSKKADSYKTKISDTAVSVSSDGDGEAVYVSRTNKDKLSLIARSEMVSLYFDKKSYTVSICDEASGKLWTSLLKDNNGIKTSALDVAVLIDGNECVLSSQRDSTGRGLAVLEKNDKGLILTYKFEKDLEDGRKIRLNVPVAYTVENGALAVEIDCENLTAEGHSEDIVITKIRLLPYFASSLSGQEGDFILLPDGSGMTVDLSENPDEFKNISLDVYGEKTDVVLAAYGVKSGDSAFVALVEEGDAIASVRMSKALSESGCNRVYPCFDLREIEENEGEVYVSNKSYTGKIRVLYRFLSSDNAGYIGMAGAIRELLIRNGTLLSQKEESGTYPFNLSLALQNSVTNTKGKTLSQTLTTFEEALEILSSLKAKGFTRINLVLDGLVKKGNDYEIDYSVGSKEDLSSLVSYCKNQGIDLYVQSDILSAAEGETASDSALTLSGEEVTMKGRVCLSLNGADKNINSLLNFAEKEGLGVYISDAGSLLYSDSSKGETFLKNEAKDIISKEVGSVSALESLFVDTGNIYTVKYADMVINLPSSAKYQSRDLCSSVPFIQAVLHGITDYSLSAANLEKNSEKAFLKAVEYGAVPYCKWYASDLSTAEEADEGYYMNSINGAQSQYERMASDFSDLQNSRITDHRLVQKGVYYTEYDGTTGIYVNYNSKEVTVGGVTVAGMSFLRVN